jgi:FkbM family methyltransferase
MMNTIKLSLRNAARVVTPSLLATYIRTKWDREPEIDLLPALCDPARISFDVGANWGQYAEALSYVSAGVVACEPVPQLAEYLRRTARKGIRVEQIALSNVKGDAEFAVPQDWGRSSLLAEKADSDTQRLAVRLDTLDSMATDPVGFIKVDVEGHEEEVIDGAFQVIARDHPVLLIEIEERHRPGALPRILARLSEEGYSAFFLHEGCLHSIATFDQEKHQNPAEVEDDPSGKVIRGCYINNFLFIHKNDLAEREKQLTKLGYKVIN